MKKLLTIILLFSSSLLVAQNLHYFKINIGPKYESYKVSGNEKVNALFHMDAGASIYLGKRFTENVYAEVGLLKNDYSAKFDVTTMGLGSREYRWFYQDLYPTFSSTQVALNVGWRQPYSQKISFYGSAGFQLFLSKKLRREGSQQHTRESIEEVNGVKETIDLYTFSNGFEEGNVLFRADLGTFIKVSKFLFVDLGFTARSATDVINEFQIEYTSFSESEKKTATLRTHGAGFMLNVGVKYQIAKFSK